MKAKLLIASLQMKNNKELHEKLNTTKLKYK